MYVTQFLSPQKVFDDLFKEVDREDVQPDYIIVSFYINSRDFTVVLLGVFRKLTGKFP